MLLVPSMYVAWSFVVDGRRSLGTKQGLCFPRLTVQSFADGWCRAMSVAEWAVKGGGVLIDPPPAAGVDLPPIPRRPC